MSWNQPQYPPYQGAPPSPYPSQPAYGQPSYGQPASYGQQAPPPVPSCGSHPSYQQPSSFQSPPPQHSAYQAPPPQPYGASGPPYNSYPPPAHAPPPPPMNSYPMAGHAAPAFGASQQQQPSYSNGYGGGIAVAPQQMWYLGTEVSPIEGMSMGMPLSAPQNYNAGFDSDRLRKAMKGFGTDEKALIAVLTPLTAVQMNAVSRQFQAMTGKSLVKEIESETRGWFENALRGLVMGPLAWDAWLVHRACSGIGTHEDLLNELLIGRSNADIHLLKAAYRAMYNRDLVSVVEGDLSMKTKRAFTMALVGNRDESTFVNHQAVSADVESLYRAGAGKIGTDEIAVCGILLNRSNAHLAALAQAYPQRHRHSLSQMIHGEFSGHMRDALLHIVRFAESDGLGVQRDAEKLEEAMAGLGTKDERLIWRVIRAHWERPRWEAVKAAYQRTYGKPLNARIRGETSGDYGRLLSALTQ